VERVREMALDNSHEKKNLLALKPAYDATGKKVKLELVRVNAGKEPAPNDGKVN